ncbi:MAG TPA: TonB family protein [Pseudidiomarina sp.]|nr:TonB family protein [Pseudidiomarina sp.]
MKTKHCLGLLLLGSCILYNPEIQALDVQHDFEVAYRDYQALLNADSSPRHDLSIAALHAFETGKAYFGEDSLNTANLAINFLKTATHPAKHHENSRAIGELVLDVYESQVDKTDARWLDAYIAAMSVPFSMAKKRRLRDDYLDFIEPLQEVNPELYALTLVDGVKSWNNDKFDLAEIIEPRLANLKQKLPESNPGVLQLELYLGNFYMNTRSYDNAIESYHRVINSDLDDTAASQRAVLLSHAALVQLYEQDGKSELATEHCLAIGSMQPWRPNQKPEPLFRVSAAYPVAYALERMSGSVALRFDIDTSGFVTNLRTVDAEDVPRLFVKSAKEAVQRWRYAPKFEDGKPVVAKDQMVQIDYSIDG